MDYGEYFQVKAMAQEEKRVIVPMIHVKHNEDEMGLSIDVDLAGKIITMVKSEWFR